jgi:hypothetical protein
MLWTPQKGATKVISNLGIVGTAAPGTAVVSNGTTNLDGAVTEIISAANNVQDSWGIGIQIFATSAAPSTLASQGCVDILIGGATDDVLIPALICGHVGNTELGIGYFFPLHIPAGVRIAATYANVKVSHSIQMIMHLYGGSSPPPWRVGSRVTTYGTQVDNARGQAVTPTASGGAASVTQMTASSTYDHFAFMAGFQPETDTTVTQKHYNIGIGVGASTEERIGTWHYFYTAAEEARGPIPAFPCFRDVPAGTRLTILASNSGTNDAAYGSLIYAVS